MLRVSSFGGGFFSAVAEQSAIFHSKCSALGGGGQKWQPLKVAVAMPYW